MEKDYLIEEINNFKDMRKNLWATVVIITGGLIGLIYKICLFSLNISSFVDLLLLIFGTALDYFFISCIISYNKDIYKLLLKIREVKS